MSSERALLIKQRQQEALRRQKEEIAERDAIRKQKELGITASSQPSMNNQTPQTVHDLFNSRFKPTTESQMHSYNNHDNNSGADARLKAY